MSSQLAAWVALGIIAVVFIWIAYAFILGVHEMRRTREARSSRTPSTIRATYGPGYGLLGWEEDWGFEHPAKIWTSRRRITVHYG